MHQLARKSKRLLALASVASAFISFVVLSEVGEVDFYGTAGLVRYSWVCWFFLPVPIITFICSIRLKKMNEHYLSYMIIACLVAVWLIAIGGFAFYSSSNVNFDSNYMIQLEDKTALDLPNEVKQATEFRDGYTLSVIKILNDDEKNQFENSLANENWTDTLTFDAKGVVPYFVQIEMLDCNYFYFYNGESCSVPTESGEYMCSLVAYRKDEGKLVVMTDCHVILQ